MLEIRLLTQIDAADLKRVASHYSSDSKYIVVHTDSLTHVSFDLQLVPLNQTYVKKYDHFDAETVELYNQAIRGATSYGAFEEDLLVGFIITEVRHWNDSLWVWEFHVADTHHRQGIGKRLMDHAVAAANTLHLRTVICETQSTNASAVHVYRKLGFHMEGVDISYYTNTDFPDGEMAVFMKRRLP